MGRARDCCYDEKWKVRVRVQSRRLKHSLLLENVSKCGVHESRSRKTPVVVFHSTLKNKTIPKYYLYVLISNKYNSQGTYNLVLNRRLERTLTEEIAHNNKL